MPEDKKCNRCGEWHQRLFKIHDNTKDGEVFECLDCLAELLIGRGQHGDSLIGKSDIRRMLSHFNP